MRQRSCHPNRPAASRAVVRRLPTTRRRRPWGTLPEMKSPTLIGSPIMMGCFEPASGPCASGSATWKGAVKRPPGGRLGRCWPRGRWGCLLGTASCRSSTGPRRVAPRLSIIHGSGLLGFRNTRRGHVLEQVLESGGGHESKSVAMDQLHVASRVARIGQRWGSATLGRGVIGRCLPKK